MNSVDISSRVTLIAICPSVRWPEKDGGAFFIAPYWPLSFLLTFHFHHAGWIQGFNAPNKAEDKQ